MTPRDATQREVRFEVPRRIADLVGGGDEALSREAREALVLSLYQQRKVSGGFAASVLGLSRRAFLDLLAARRIPSIQYDEGDLERELEACEDAGAE